MASDSRKESVSDSKAAKTSALEGSRASASSPSRLPPSPEDLTFIDGSIVF